MTDVNLTVATIINAEHFALSEDLEASARYMAECAANNHQEVFLAKQIEFSGFNLLIQNSFFFKTQINTITFVRLLDITAEDRIFILGVSNEHFTTLSDDCVNCVHLIQENEKLSKECQSWAEIANRAYKESEVKDKIIAGLKQNVEESVSTLTSQTDLTSQTVQEREVETSSLKQKLTEYEDVTKSLQLTNDRLQEELQQAKLRIIDELEEDYCFMPMTLNQYLTLAVEVLSYFFDFQIDKASDETFCIKNMGKLSPTKEEALNEIIVKSAMTTKQFQEKIVQLMTQSQQIPANSGLTSSSNRLQVQIANTLTHITRIRQEYTEDELLIFALFILKNSIKLLSF
jgi:hypothetical protein